MGDADKKKELLHGPLKKIERAKQHIRDLDRAISEYLAGRPLELRVRERKDGHDRLIYVETDPPIPDEIPLIIGDAVHNLRTALDQICFGMVGGQAKNPAGVGFPFISRQPFTIPESLDGAIATRQMHLAGKNVIQAIHDLRPYPGGNEYFYAIKTLDERDKHHLILTVALHMEMSLGDLGVLIGEDKIAGKGPPSMRLGTAGDFIVKITQPSPETIDQKAQVQPPSR